MRVIVFPGLPRGPCRSRCVGRWRRERDRAQNPRRCAGTISSRSPIRCNRTCRTDHAPAFKQRVQSLTASLKRDCSTMHRAAWPGFLSPLNFSLQYNRIISKNIIKAFCKVIGPTGAIADPGERLDMVPAQRRGFCARSLSRRQRPTQRERQGPRGRPGNTITRTQTRRIARRTVGNWRHTTIAGFSRMTRC